jgi:hypothetical protein
VQRKCDTIKCANKENIKRIKTKEIENKAISMTSKNNLSPINIFLTLLYELTAICEQK